MALSIGPLCSTEERVDNTKALCSLLDSPECLVIERNAFVRIAALEFRFEQSRRIEPVDTLPALARLDLPADQYRRVS